MIKVNENYQKLQASYLFSTISKKVNAFLQANPKQSIIRLGIGDVTLPLAPSIIKAFEEGVAEMANSESFKGYGPEQGYDFLREAVAKEDFVSRGCAIGAHEVFISDGSKCDVGNFQELFAQDILIGIPDPVYPVYVDTNVMAGRTGAAINGRYEGFVYLEGNKENGFIPSPPKDQALDLIYLCFPNNPTGAVATKEQLKAWVDYARKNKAIILFDAAYAAFIQDPNLPRSIYEVEGAREVAVEFRSWSKTAGFTGTRCAYTIVPDSVMAYTSQGEPVPLIQLWNRRHTTKFNGVSYPVQRAAAAVYSPQGKKETAEQVALYMGNSKLIREKMVGLGYEVIGGQNAPYVWVNLGQDSWQSFDTLLEKAAVVVTPGAGFGTCGQGWIRISAFNHRDKVIEALARLEKALQK